MVLEQNQKIGIGLICLGLVLVTIGILWFFDAALIAMGNVSFLAGLCMSIGWERAKILFIKEDKRRGTLLFFFGIFLVVYVRWGFIGIVVEGIGFLNLFGNFLPIVLTVAKQVPILSKILALPGVSHMCDFIVGNSKPKFSV